MGRSKKYLAIDLGASSGRGIVGSFDGEKLSLRENCRFANEPVMACGRLYWDILRIFHEIKNSIRRTVLDGDDITSIGIDTWGVDYGLLDSRGRLISNPAHYRDTRTAGIMEYATGIVRPEDIYAVTGIQHMEFNTLYQLCAENREDDNALKRAERLLFIPDLLNYFLTGKMATEYTIASTGSIIDARKREISDTLLAGFNIPPELFSPLVMPGNRLGGLLPSVLGDVGKTTAQIVNVASHDTASAVISVPAKGRRNIYISSGTWSLMGRELDEPLINDDTCRANFTNEGGAEGTVRFLKNIMGLWVIQESRRQWIREGGEYSFAELETMARAERPFACLIDPDDKRFALPGDMPRRVSDFCRESGQHIPERPGEIIRCIYESLALKYRMTAEGIETLTGAKSDGINIVGGGSKDSFLCRMTADACGIPVTAGPAEATAIGNIVVQAISAGEIRDIAEARGIISASFEPAVYEPENTPAWDCAYDKFKEIIRK